MAGEYSPEYSDVAPKRPTPIEAKELLGRRSHRLQLEIGVRALSFGGNTVLNQPETSYKILERDLRASIIGQDQAIDAIIEAMDRSRVRLADNPRPLATLAFLGPTGVGKSETAKVLAEFISGGDPRLVKIDCSNFSHGHEVASLIGSPPGYVGHDQTPLLNKKRVEKYGTVVLFDEIEKGSEALYNLMLQILGDGALQLNDGTTTSFRNTMIILTSNLGAKEMSEHLSKTPIGFMSDNREEPSAEVINKSARQAFEKFFKPEFVNRLDGTIVFNPLDREGLGQVLENKLAEANYEYSESYGMEVALTDGTREYLVDKALEERGKGARPLVRAFEKDIQGSFGRYMGGGQLHQGYCLQVYHRSECPEDVQETFPDQDLIFTYHFDEALWQVRENFKERLAEEKRKAEEAKRRAEEEKNASQVVFDPGDQTPPDNTPEN